MNSFAYGMCDRFFRHNSVRTDCQHVMIRGRSKPTAAPFSWANNDGTQVHRQQEPFRDQRCDVASDLARFVSIKLYS